MFLAVVVFFTLQIVWSIDIYDYPKPISKSACGLPITSTTQSTTTISTEGIRCWGGIGHFTDCEWPKRSPEDLAKCKEENKQIAQKAYALTPCSREYTECYSFSHRCHFIDEGHYYVEKGCALSGNATCHKFDSFYLCRFGDAPIKNCEQCKGFLCNKKDIY